MASSSDLGYNIGEIFTEKFDDLIFVLNKDYECEYVNEKIQQEKLGYISLKENIRTIFHQDDLPLSNIFLQNLLKYGQAVETLRVRQKEDYGYYEFKGKSFKNEKQENKLLIIARDIPLFKLKYTGIVENIREAYFEVDLKGAFVFMNKSFAQMTGYSHEELVGKHHLLLMNDENKNKVFKIFNMVYKSGLPQEFFQFEFINKGNKKVIVETSVYLNKDPSGKKIGFYGITRDITQRFHLEQKVKQSEEKYRHLFKSSPYAIWIVDLNGVVIDSNSPKNILLPKNSKDNLIGKNFIEILGMFERPEYFIPFFKSKFENFVKDTPMKALEFKMTRTDGTEKWVNIIASKIKLDDDMFVKILMQDITEKKIADLKLQKSDEELRVLNKELERMVLERTKELRESEEKFRTIAENSLMGVAILQDNKIKYVNQQFTTLAGYDENEVKKFSPMDIFQSIHPDDRKLVIEQLRIKQKGFKDYISHYQYRIFDKTGGIKWLDNYSKTINFMGRPADLVSAVDITDRKKAEQELKESEEKFRTITEYSTVGIIILQDEKVKYVNKAMLDINEFTMNEMMLWTPKDFINFTHPEDRKKTIKDLMGRRTRNVTPPFYSSYRILTKSGKARWIDTYSTTITYLGQTADLTLVTDVTDQNFAKQELKESEEKYRHLFEHSPYSIVLMDYTGKIVDMNTKTTELFGYKKEDILDKNYLTLAGIFPKETKPGLRLVRDLISKRESSNHIMKPQLTKIYNKEKKSMWVESELSSVNIGGKQMIQVIIQDITDKKLAEEKLKESEQMLREQNIELKELDRLKTDFISIAAHDLKTPLFSVGGYIDLILLREKELKEEVKEDLNRVSNNVRRLEEYINRLLDVMKIDAKKVELAKKEENIYKIIANCLSDLEFQIDQKKLKINLDISENLLLNVDHFRISQVFLNLLSNAIKFTPEDGKIDISLTENDQRVVFSIKDNGKGLTPGEMQKIFGKFVTIEQGVNGYSTLDKGSGLGLYIAKGFIEAHGGKIWVESGGVGLGSDFSFVLPK